MKNEEKNTSLKPEPKFQLHKPLESHHSKK